MKKLLILGIAFMAFLAINATAGDYHSGTTLNCAECHVMHFSEAHNLTDDGESGHGNVELGADGPYHYLLRNHVNELCLTCHDGNFWAPDVLGAPTGAVTNRLGGALNVAGGTVTGYHESDGHSLGFAGSAPGQTGASATAAWTNEDGLDCIDCHTQHGRKAGSGATATQIYRNLSWPGSSATAGYMSYAVGTNDLTKDVFERFPASYSNDDVDFNEPVATASDYALFCSKCHGDFHGNAASANMRNQASTSLVAEWLRHPVANADIGAAGGGGSRMSAYGARTYRVKTLSASGNWGTQGTALGTTTGVGDFTPSCMSCHKAHGTTNAYGLIFPNYDYTTATMTAITENGGGTDYMGLCRQCHGQ